jgi:hypothetical protein|tara:strand:+ start:264 stop:506 length:243 start_codon:yes stop_codon:yes gene_type:complete
MQTHSFHHNIGYMSGLRDMTQEELIYLLKKIWQAAEESKHVGGETGKYSSLAAQIAIGQMAHYIIELIEGKTNFVSNRPA